MSLPGPVSDCLPLLRLLWNERGIGALPGDVAEFGCFEGGLTRQLSRLAPDRWIWAFDTFDDAPVESFGRHPWLDPSNMMWPGQFKPRLTVTEMFSAFPNVMPLKGKFTDTMPLHSHAQFSLVVIDCDFYQAHVDVLKWLADGHLVPGAAIFFEDLPFLAGARRAAQEFVREHQLETVPELRAVFWHLGRS